MDDISNDRSPSEYRIASEHIAAAIKRSKMRVARDAFFMGFGVGLAVGSVLVGLLVNLILWGGVF